MRRRRSRDNQLRGWFRVASKNGEIVGGACGTMEWRRRVAHVYLHYAKKVLVVQEKSGEKNPGQSRGSKPRLSLAGDLFPWPWRRNRLFWQPPQKRRQGSRPRESDRIVPRAETYVFARRTRDVSPKTFLAWTPKKSFFSAPKKPKKSGTKSAECGVRGAECEGEKTESPQRWTKKVGSSRLLTPDARPKTPDSFRTRGWRPSELAGGRTRRACQCSFWRSFRR
jgi:hypothetical protein